MSKPKRTCCLCHKEYWGHGNNAQPLSKGACCDSCNLKKVVPARINNLNKKDGK